MVILFLQKCTICLEAIAAAVAADIVFMGINEINLPLAP
jgi:hypothetical protein